MRHSTTFLTTSGWGSDEPNHYTYTGNDPLDGTDPTGLANACTEKGCGEASDDLKAPKEKTQAATGSHIPGVHTGATGQAQSYPDGVRSVLGPESAPLLIPAGEGVTARILGALADLLGIASSDEKLTPKVPGTRAELETDLKSKGFVNQGTNPGGYTTYRNPDGRVVTIKPTGEVIPTSPAVSSTGKAYNQRTDYNFNRLPDQSHSTGHFVEPIDGAE